jgi:hypothetical protein
MMNDESGVRFWIHRSSFIIHSTILWINTGGKGGLALMQ